MWLKGKAVQRSRQCLAALQALINAKLILTVPDNLEPKRKGKIWAYKSLEPLVLS